MKPYRSGHFPEITSATQAGQLLCLYPELMETLMSEPSFRIWLRQADPEKAERAIKHFTDEKDPQVGLFKASYELAPAHSLIYQGTDFKDLKGLGEAILNSAPDLDKAAYALFESKALDWYLERQKIFAREPKLKEKLSTVLSRQDTIPGVSYFRLGYALTDEKRFFFKKEIYPSIQEFFIRKGNDKKLFAEYDFLTMPYAIAYHLSCGYAKELSFAQGLAKTCEDADKAFLKAEKNSGK